MHARCSGKFRYAIWLLMFGVDSQIPCVRSCLSMTSLEPRKVAPISCLPRQRYKCVVWS
uniref:Secreted protein n=1 Tax=Setaria viridis TaxID=4556 RepID=A0A4U6VBQ8_SETVI|nr:hypothetical protein SEVIR_3G207666v2 [Setaria viridis]